MFDTEVKQNIEILKSCREILWSSGYKRSTVIILPYLSGIYDIKSKLDENKEYISSQIYKNFVQEYNMTIYLFYKCMIKLKNKYESTILEPDMNKINDLISNFGGYIETITDLDTTVSLLRKEDTSLQKTLSESGLPEDKITEIIAAGYALPNVLDEEPKNNLKK